MYNRFRFLFNATIATILLLGVSCTSLNGNRTPASDEARNYPPGSLRYIIWNSYITDPAKLPNIEAVKQAKPEAAAQIIEGIKKLQLTIMGSPFPKVDGIKDFSEYSPAQVRYRTMLLVARSQAPAFFKELRFAEPVFFLPGDSKEKSTYLLARYKDVDESFGAEGVPPAHLTVIYTDTMEKTLPGRYMLSGEGTDANKEKPKMVEVVAKATDKHGTESVKEMQARVRKVVKQLMFEVLREKTTANTIDIAPAVSRNVPLGLVSDYFGFYPPDLHTQIQWSRNTQNAFFHNPMNVDGLNKLSIGSGAEMQAYIKAKMLPELQQQLKNGRPAYDTVSKMLMGHAELKGVDRVTANIMGLLVGAGETSTLAVTRSVKNLIDRPEIYKAAVAAAKKADRNSATDKDQEAFDHYVWEALRYQPINPWVERRAIHDYTIESLREGQTTADKTVPVTKDARVLVAMESAMMDSDYFKDPEQFKLDRDLNKYFHMSFDYHKCLGDDVAKVLIPEIVKALLVNFDNLTYAATPDAKGSPFPESWVLNFTKKSKLVGIKPVQFPKAKAYFMSDDFIKATDGADEVSAISAYLQQNESPERVMNSVPPFRLDIGGMMKRDAALMTLQAKMMAQDKKLGSRAVCNSMMTEDINKQSREDFCALPYKFRACHFLNRVAGQKSAQHAFNQCAYGFGLLTPSQTADLATTLGKRSPAFAFLTYK